MQKMAPALSKIANSKANESYYTALLAAGVNGKILALLAGGGIAFIYTVVRHHARSTALRKSDTAANLQKVLSEKQRTQKVKARRPAVDGVFFSQLRNIFNILIPKWWCKETGYMLMVAASLCARTYADVWLITNGTSIESAIIGRDKVNFLRHLFRFIAAMPLISAVNASLKFSRHQLKLKFRVRLTEYLYDKYLGKFTYYKMSNLDNRISNPDQLLTQDVERFCNAFTELYSNLSKPLLDIFIYVQKLTGSIGAQGPVLMVGYLMASALFLTHIRARTAIYTAEEQQYEGEFRYVNSRLITHSEEIAFYQGDSKEKKTIMSVFSQLVEHIKSFNIFKFRMGFIDNIVAKYIATVFGYLSVSRPFLNLFNSRYNGWTHNMIMEDYYESGRMLLRLAEAIGRIAMSGRELTSLAGFTNRLTGLITVLDELRAGTYQRTMVATVGNSLSLRPGSGRLRTTDYVIRFDKVPLVTPNGDVLIQELTFQVNKGANVLVSGPNGSGKSSLFRVLSGLWPIFGGELTKPPAQMLAYIPQRPYMTIGTLRDQIIFPDTHEEMLVKGRTDADLLQYITNVKLQNILERSGSWDAFEDWMDVLSGGEKQRIAMARIFYRQPQFAILDECTSNVSVDVEDFIYQHCKKVGITLFTVSHRTTLWKHHEFHLHFDGKGHFTFESISDDTPRYGSS